MACSDEASEKELKLIVYESMLSGRLRSLSASTVVLAVPAAPTSITGTCMGRRRSRRKVRRVVSIVGTTIDANGALGTCEYATMRSRQCPMRRAAPSGFGSRA